MAQLILSAEEMGAQSWFDLDDATLGKIVKSNALKMLADVAPKKEDAQFAWRMTAGLMLIDHAIERNDVGVTFDVLDMSDGKVDLGDWRVQAIRLRDPAIRADANVVLRGLLPMLTPAQVEHVNRVPFSCRVEMAEIFARGDDVCIGQQDDCGPDVPPIAIWPKDRPDFFIECCATIEDAVAYASNLGLNVVSAMAPSS